MKLTKRQLDTIAGIMSDESKQRRSLHEGMYASRRKYLLAEAGDVSFDNMGSLAYEALEQDMLDMGSEVRVKFDKALFGVLSDLVARAGAEKVSGPVLMEDLEDFDEELLMNAQQEFASDLAAALEKYTKEITQLVADAKLPPEGYEE